MNSLNGIKFLFSSRGLSRWAARLVTVNERFFWTPKKQMGIINKFVSCLKEEGCQGNFFIPAILLKEYIDELKKVDPAVIEWGIHGLVHTDHSQLEFEEQKAQLTEAVAVFDRCGIDFKGFRCPYLRSNSHTRKILSLLGRFKFDSSDSVVFEDLYGADAKHYGWIKNFYGAKKYVSGSLKPYVVDQVIEIPVSLPDDDITADRENFAAEDIYGMWSSMLKTCHTNGEVFVLQLHPERFLRLENVLRKLIKEAKALKPAIWMTTLSQVAAWSGERDHAAVAPPMYQGAFCITGDIDAVTIQDFFRRLKDW